MNVEGTCSFEEWTSVAMAFLRFWWLFPTLGAERAMADHSRSPKRSIRLPSNTDDAAMTIALPDVEMDSRIDRATRQLPRGWVWIYFIQDDRGGPVKIGRTRGSPALRVVGLQVGYPFARLRLVGLLRGPIGQERRYHARFEHLHLRGEWFSPAPDLLEFVRSIRAPEPLATAEVTG